MTQTAINEKQQHIITHLSFFIVTNKAIRTKRHLVATLSHKYKDRF